MSRGEGWNPRPPSLTSALTMSSTTETVSRILSIAVVHEFLSKDEQAIINIHEVGNRILDEVTHGTLDPAKSVKLKLEGAQQFWISL